MAASRALRRLLRVRNLQEELSRVALETGLGVLHQLESTKSIAEERERSGHRLIVISAQSGEVEDRLAGLVEMHTAARQADLLAQRIVEAEREVAALRQEFLDKRVERRQAETVLQQREERAACEADRRRQQASDDWFLSKQAHVNAEVTQHESTHNRQATERS